MTFIQVARGRPYWQARKSQIAYDEEDKGSFQDLNTITTVNG